MVLGGHDIVLWCWGVMRLSCGAGEGVMRLSCDAGGHEIVLWCWDVMKLSCGAGMS